MHLAAALHDGLARLTCPFHGAIGPNKQECDAQHSKRAVLCSASLLPNLSARFGCYSTALSASPPCCRFWVFYRFYHDFDHFVVSYGKPAMGSCTAPLAACFCHCQLLDRFLQLQRPTNHPAAAPSQLVRPDPVTMCCVSVFTRCGVCGPAAVRPRGTP